MKNPITKMQLCAVMFFAFVLFFNSHLKAQYFPDEEMFDTTGLIDETLVDGMDTVWYWDYGTGELEGSDYYRTSSDHKSYYSSDDYSQYAKVHADSTIYISLGSNRKPTMDGLFGFHIAGIYGRKQIPNDPSALDQWGWMSDLAPSSLRFPGGADSKFMHLMEGPGYGYILEEIINFYDRTDYDFNAPSYEDIVDSISNINTSVEFYQGWMEEKEVDDFKGFADKWLEQQILDSSHLFIDDFIAMVKQIEDENPGHKVDVIVDLNIMNETASKCREIVEYLRDNDSCEINVVYVELGNEMYFAFSESMLGIYTLEDYWTYINGGITDSLDIDLIGSDVWSDHDYISEFKSDPLFTCKIGLPVENLHDPYYAFREAGTAGSRAVNDWNDDIFEKRLEKVAITGLTGHYRKSFDAYVVHPYYDTHNWDTCALNI